MPAPGLVCVAGTCTRCGGPECTAGDGSAEVGGSSVIAGVATNSNYSRPVIGERRLLNPRGRAGIGPIELPLDLMQRHTGGLRLMEGMDSLSWRHGLSHCCLCGFRAVRLGTGVFGTKDALPLGKQRGGKRLRT